MTDKLGPRTDDLFVAGPTQEPHLTRVQSVSAPLVLLLAVVLSATNARGITDYGW